MSIKLNAAAANNKSENANKYHQQSILGGFTSFDGDSLPDYSEFDSESVTQDYYKERYNNPFNMRCVLSLLHYL